MAAKAISTRATLKDLPTDFSLSFLKGPSISLKSRQQGFKYCAEEYYHDVKMFIDEDRTIFCSARCYASYRTKDEPRNIHLDIKPTEISLAHCSCQAGYVKDWFLSVNIYNLCMFLLKCLPTINSVLNVKLHVFGRYRFPCRNILNK